MTPTLDTSAGLVSPSGVLSELDIKMSSGKAKTPSPGTQHSYLASHAQASQSKMTAKAKMIHLDPATKRQKAEASSQTEHNNRPASTEHEIGSR